MKHEVYMCTECLHCRDPEIYCKFRSSCAIRFMEKDGGLQDKLQHVQIGESETGG